MKKRIIESKEKTFYIKSRGIPKGCKLCLKGAKTVLFLNGICQLPAHCSWYCPISEERKGRKISYVNEIRINDKRALLEEINKCKAKGMSITGGEPLFELNINQTLEYIKFIKNHKGNKFHVHLYTNGINFNERIAEALANAGLDEIRFNPPKNKWSNIKLALDRGMKVGAEVPVIPEANYLDEIEELIFYLDEIGAHFINLNEFEYCFPNSLDLRKKGFKLKEGTIASVENSSIFAKDIIKKIGPKVSIKLHYCSIIAKDYFQLKNRYYRRAYSIKRPYEDVTDEGLLIFAEIKGNIEPIGIFYDILKSKYKLEPPLIRLMKNKIHLPVKVTLNEDFISKLENLTLDCNIIETIPFRDDEYRQITESTPIRVFMREIIQK